MKKLLGSRGETITETLAAILIVAMSAVILATMTAASVRITRSANAASEKLYQQISAAESGDNQAKGTVTVGGETVEVMFYGDKDGVFTSYRKQEAGS